MYVVVARVARNVACVCARVCSCVCVCMGACACRSFAVAANLKIPSVLVVAVVSSLPLMPRANHRCLPHWLPPFLQVQPSFRRNCKWSVSDLNFTSRSSNAIAAPDLNRASRAPKDTSRGFSVSNRESSSPHFSDNSKKVFPQPPRAAFPFAFCDPLRFRCAPSPSSSRYLKIRFLGHCRIYQALYIFWMRPRGVVCRSVFIMCERYYWNRSTAELFYGTIKIDIR